MCSIMIVCVLLERLPLIAALGGARRDLIGEPVPLAPEPGREQCVGEVSPVAEAFGIVPGIRVGEALSRSPDLRLLPADPEATREYWNAVLDRLESLGAAVESVAGRSAVPVQVHIALNGRMPEPVEATAYFVVTESLANVAKYAHASSVRVEVARRDGTLHVEVSDDGQGGADIGRGSGLRGLEDRVAAVGGRLRIESPMGSGTRVVAEIPSDA